MERKGKQYAICHGSGCGAWLQRIDRDKGGSTYVFRTEVERAMIYEDKAAAVGVACRMGYQVWRMKDGKPDRRVWPEGGGAE
jgi:hypothetical protein